VGALRCSGLEVGPKVVGAEEVVAEEVGAEESSVGLLVGAEDSSISSLDGSTEGKELGTTVGSSDSSDGKVLLVGAIEEGAPKDSLSNVGPRVVGAEEVGAE